MTEGVTTCGPTVGASKASSSFPTRAYIQSYGGIPPPDYAPVVAELRSRGSTEVLLFDTLEDAPAHSPPPDAQSLVLGDFSWTKGALAFLKIPLPAPPDYPACLLHLLHRRIGTSTLGEIPSLVAAGPPGAQTFIKPASDVKAFAAIIEPKDQMLACLLEGIPGVMDKHNPDTAVYYSDLVKMSAEYRVYVVDGRIRAVCNYKRGDESSPGENASIDLAVVETAVAAFAASHEGADVSVGCGMDFALLHRPRPSASTAVTPISATGDTADQVQADPTNQNDKNTAANDEEVVTCLVEVNDGVSLGLYNGLSGKDYTDLLCARWQRLVRCKERETR